MGNKTSDATSPNLHRYIMGGLLLLIIGVGTWLSLEARNHADRNIRGEMLRQTSNIASCLSMENVRDLSFRAEDIEKPAFHRIASQLQAYAQTAGMPRLYTLGLRDGQLFSGPESLLPDDPTAAPPGTLHQNPPQADFDAFRAAEAATFGPYSDESGEIISAIFPVFDPLTGEVLLVVGLDMEASVWRNKLNQAQQIPIWSSLSLLSLLLLGYLVHGVYKRSPNMRVERLRNIAISIYFAIMLLLAVIAFICARDAEQRAQQELFRAEANAKSQYFTDATEQIDLVLHLLIGFFEASENIDREEFGAFCRHIFEGYPIDSCYWIPAWSANDAPTFTARIQAEGFPDFSIRRFADDNRPVLDSADPIYPVVYVESASRPSATLGYDFYSHPILRETLVETLRSGSDHACMVSVPTANSNEPTGFFVFAPISHPRQGGLVCFSINLEALFKGSNLSSETAAIAATLFELQPDKKPRALACSSCDQCDAMLDAELSARTPFFAFGNTYMMLFTAAPTWLGANAQHAAWWILAIGLTLALLLTYTAAVLINRPLLLEKLASQRTRELSESKQLLCKIIDTMPERIWWKDLDSRYLGCNIPVAHDAGFDHPDQLIGKTDFDMCWAVHAEVFRATDREVMKSGIPRIYDPELQVMEDGSTRWIEVSMIPLKDTKGKIFGVLGTYSDITERKQAQSAIEQSADRLRRAQQVAQVGNWEFNMETGAVSASDEAKRIYGLEGRQWTISEIQKIPLEKYRDVLDRALEALIEHGKPYDVEFPIKRGGDGALREIHSVAEYDPGKKLVFGVIQDITDRKQAALSLALSEAKYRDLFEQSADACLIIKEGRFVDCNQAATEMLRCEDKEQLINTHPAELSPERQPDGALSREKANEIMQRVETEKTLRFEWVHKRADGELFPVEVSLTSITDSEGNQITYTTWRDLTARKQAQENLVRLSTAIDQSPESIVITDHNGDIQYVNPAFETNTGYTADEAVGQNPRILKSEEHPPSFYKTIWDTISNGKIWEGRIHNKRKNGTLFTEEATISPVRDSNGCIVNYVAVKRDISGELVKEEELRQAQKMEAVGELAGGVAHDFNNILQGIIGFSELLRYALDDASLEYKNADEIHRAATRAAKLTQQLLTFSRKQAVRLEEMDLNNVVYDSEALLNVLLGDSYEIVLDLQDELPSVFADQGQLTQVIMNLAVNARDAMPDGGRLSISTECILVSEPDAAYIAGARPGRYLCLAVTDTGSGMNEQTQSRIFDPFFTTKEVGTGTGLGLAVIYGIIKQNNGWINVYSEIGKGSCFKVYLPVAVANEAPSNDDPATLSEGRNARILLIEDDPKILEMVKKILSQDDLIIIAAGSAEEGLVLFDQSADRFDLLMSDMELPGMRGDELAEALRIKDPELPVLLFSGYRDQVNRWKHLADKEYTFLNKPFTISILLDTVRNILNDKKGIHG